MDAPSPVPYAWLKIAQSDLPSDTLVGELDADLYQPGARPQDLSALEIENEKAKGNIFTVGEFRRQLENAYQWELQVREKAPLRNGLALQFSQA